MLVHLLSRHVVCCSNHERNWPGLSDRASVNKSKDSGGEGGIFYDKRMGLGMPIVKRAPPACPMAAPRTGRCVCCATAEAHCHSVVFHRRLLITLPTTLQHDPLTITQMRDSANHAACMSAHVPALRPRPAAWDSTASLRPLQVWMPVRRDPYTLHALLQSATTTPSTTGPSTSSSSARRSTSSRAPTSTPSSPPTWPPWTAA